MAVGLTEWVVGGVIIGGALLFLIGTLGLIRVGLRTIIRSQRIRLLLKRL